MWRYTRLADTIHLGSQMEWHRFDKDDQSVIFSYDNGDDTETSILVNGQPWGKMQLDHPVFNGVDFGSPETLFKVCDYVTSIEMMLSTFNK